MSVLFISKDFLRYISSPLRTEISYKIKAKKIPELQLEIPKEVLQKFNKIYSLYSEGDFSSKRNLDFVTQLNANNQWEKAKLIYLAETYKVKIKLHGKSPTQHVERYHYSLGIKLRNGKKIKGVSRFNLIIYWRIRDKFDIIRYLAQNLGIYYQEDELISVIINNRSPKLYYFEYRIDQEYFKKVNKENLIVLKLKSDHSLIYTGGDIETWNENLNTAIKKTGRDDSLCAILYDKYSKLNEAIYGQDAEKVLSHFELDYLVRIQAFRYLYADNGHGFGLENLLVAIDTTNFKFYPFVHRDNSPCLLNLSEINDRMDGRNIGSDTPLFETLSKSNLLAQETKAYLIRILRDGSINSFEVDSIMQEHGTYYYSSRIKYLLGMADKHPASENIKLLKHLLLIP